MTEKVNETQGYGRLMNINDLCSYLNLGRNSSRNLGKSANAIVRIGTRVLYDRKKIDSYIDSQAQDR